MVVTIGETVFLEDEWFDNPGGGAVLMGSRCLPCDRVYFPPKRVCPNCFDGALKRVPMSTRGSLHTFAVSHMGPADLDKPYIIGFIDLPEGIRIFSLITGCDSTGSDLRIGSPMKMVIEPLKRDRYGRNVIGYKFRPVREGDPG